MFSIAVFVSGRGSNLQAVLESPKLKNLVQVKAVFSDKLHCPAFDIAERYSVSTYSIGEKEGFITFNDAKDLLVTLNIDLIVLAGFLKLIPADFVKSFRNKIINIHPALLPSFGGSGMYGINVHKAVYNSSAKVSGASIHIVDETYDTGKIIAQHCVDISDVNSPEEIAAKVLKVEHEILPDTIEKIASGKLYFDDSRIRFKS